MRDEKTSLPLSVRGTYIATTAPYMVSSVLLAYSAETAEPPHTHTHTHIYIYIQCSPFNLPTSGPGKLLAK